MEIGRAIRRLRLGKFTQEQLADATGIDQATISKVETAKQYPSIEQVLLIERALELVPGSVFHAAGFMANLRTVPEVIEADTALRDDQKRMLVAGYYAAVDQNK